MVFMAGRLLTIMSLSDIAGELQIAKQCTFVLNMIDYYYCCNYYHILIDIDECVEVPGTCDQNATFSRLIGSYGTLATLARAIFVIVTGPVLSRLFYVSDIHTHTSFLIDTGSEVSAPSISDR